MQAAEDVEIVKKIMTRKLKKIKELTSPDTTIMTSHKMSIKRMDWSQ